MYHRAIKGWEKLRTWLQIFYPSRKLKLFPPHFVMRDVVLERVEKERKLGTPCAFMLLDVKQFTEMKSLYPLQVMLQVEHSISDSFRSVVKNVFAQDEVIVVQKYEDDDFILIVKGPSHTEEFQKKIETFQQELERDIAARTASFFDFPISFHSAVTNLDPHIEDVQEALLSALQDARSIARKHLPANFGLIRSEIRQIIEEERIKVLAQPIYSLATRHITGWEILTRGPEHTPYHKPLDLFDYAYQTKLLFQLELLVMKKAFLVMAKKPTEEPVFINMTVPTLANPYFFECLQKLLSQFPQIDPNRIVLEITERHVIDDFAAFRQAISRFRQAGFKFAVDDTGAGYASLHMISELLPDVIKVDRSIIHQIDSHEVKDSVLQALLMIAKKIGSHVVAEGIETEAEVRVLLQKNVDFAQGFYFSPPQEPFLVSEEWRKTLA